MCCESFENGPEVGECPDCGGPIDENGDACYGCYYSPEDCKTCGARPCDGSC